MKMVTDNQGEWTPPFKSSFDEWKPPFPNDNGAKMSMDRDEMTSTPSADELETESVDIDESTKDAKGDGKLDDSVKDVIFALKDEENVQYAHEISSVVNEVLPTTSIEKSEYDGLVNTVAEAISELRATDTKLGAKQVAEIVLRQQKHSAVSLGDLSVNEIITQGKKLGRAIGLKSQK